MGPDRIRTIVTRFLWSFLQTLSFSTWDCTVAHWGEGLGVAGGTGVRSMPGLLEHVLHKARPTPASPRRPGTAGKMLLELSSSYQQAKASEIIPGDGRCSSPTCISVFFSVSMEKSVPRSWLWLLFAGNGNKASLISNSGSGENQCSTSEFKWSDSSIILYP